MIKYTITSKNTCKVMSNSTIKTNPRKEFLSMTNIVTDSDSTDINISQLTKELLMQWLDKKDFLSGKDKSTLFEIGCNCLSNVDTLYNLNKAVIKRQDTLTEEDGELILKAEEGRNTLIYGDKKIEFTELQLREILAGMIDILEKILPLGTVVDLKKKYLQKHISVDSIQNIRLVITHRFLYREEDTVYFPYAGVVYPLGMLVDNKVIHFTPSLIEKVVHTGYSDGQDEAYIYMMKQELILEKGMHSYGFSTEEEQSVLQNRLEAERMANND